MDPFWFRRRNCPASDTRSAGRERRGSTRPLVKTRLLPDPTRSAEQSAVTKELPGCLEKKTFPPQVETAGQRSRARPSLLQAKMTRG